MYIGRLVNETSWCETETRPRPRPSHIFTRPSRDRDVKIETTPLIIRQCYHSLHQVACIRCYGVIRCHNIRLRPILVLPSSANAQHPTCRTSLLRLKPIDRSWVVVSLWLLQVGRHLRSVRNAGLLSDFSRPLSYSAVKGRHLTSVKWYSTI